jgi:hypothetical protein
MAMETSARLCLATFSPPNPFPDLCQHPLSSRFPFDAAGWAVFGCEVAQPARWTGPFGINGLSEDDLHLSPRWLSRCLTGLTKHRAYQLISPAILMCSVFHDGYFRHHKRRPWRLRPAAQTSHLISWLFLLVFLKSYEDHDHIKQHLCFYKFTTQ